MSLLENVSDKFRVLVHQALSSPRHDHFKPLKLAREVLGTANDLVGRPFASAEELSERKRAHGVGTVVTHEPAPVMLYFDGRDHRTKKKMEEVLKARDIPFTVLDVTDDESTRSWALTAAKQAEFPLVFIAGEPVGGLHELTQLDVSGELVRRIHPPTA